MNIFSDSIDIVLLESILTFNIFRVVFEIYDLEIRNYGTVRD